MQKVIEPRSSLGCAIVEFFDALSEYFPENDVKRCEILVFGGCAVHVYTEARGSADIDAEILACDQARKEDIVATLVGEEGFYYIDDDGISKSLELDTNFNTSLGPLHEDYTDRKVRLTLQTANPRIEVYLASPVDVAISKLGRFGQIELTRGAVLSKQPLNHKYGIRYE
ncbi:DUF6036 family nucleotidyltransferase [Nitrincola sp. MINF-07-Sa-05]|uniref:DUF6036 family nucleotidyltransferase n=1 Tax=Nitrincola salilacus TaxID=3400273 RepID=UPI003917BD88